MRHALAMALVLCALAVPAGARAAAPPDAFGVYGEEVLDSAAGDRDAQLAAIAATGFGLVRSPLYWAEVERGPGRYDFAATDAAVAATARQGLRWLPAIVSTPPFRAGFRGTDPDGRSYTPPVRAADLGDFAALLVRRYGPGGVFWTTHPELPPIPVRIWQVWNEPNLPAFWRSGIDPGAYAALLRATARAIHAADPGAEVVAAGLPDSAVGMSLERFLDGFYAAGGASAGHDAIAVHPYAVSAAAALEIVRSVRGQMTRAGDDAAIRVTEAGWATGGVRAAVTGSEDRQAQSLGGLLAGLVATRRELDIRGIALFKWRDTAAAGGERDIWPHHTGLVRRDGSAKPARGGLATLLPQLKAVWDAVPAPGQARGRRRSRTRRGPRRACARARRVVRLPLRRGERVRWALVHVSGWPTVRLRVRRGRVSVPVAGLRRGRHGVGIVARTKQRRVVAVARRLRVC